MMKRSSVEGILLILQPFLTALIMDDIKDIVQSIVKGCGQGGLQTSEILAAYVARTVSRRLSLCRSLTDKLSLPSGCGE